MSYSTSIQIGAAVPTVWRAWTDSENITAWLAPKANVDFRPEGAYEFFWGDDPEKDSILGCVLLEIQPEGLLRFQWQGPTAFLPMFLPPDGRRTVIEVTFQARQGGTDVTLTQAETRDHRDWPAYEEWMSKAWGLAMTRLKECCE